MVFYNNLLSLPVLGIMMLWQGELNSLLNQREILHNPYFIAVVILTGLMSFGISFSVLWFLSTTTPTTFALVGALNKVPISIFGLFAFDSQWNALNLLSISFGLLSGVIFVIAKQKT
jgi:GDP-mannose transporter